MASLVHQENVEIRALTVNQAKVWLVRLAWMAIKELVENRARPVYQVMMRQTNQVSVVWSVLWVRWVLLAREVRPDALQRVVIRVLVELRARLADPGHLEMMVKKETTGLTVFLDGKVVMARLVTRVVMGPKATMVIADH